MSDGNLAGAGNCGGLRCADGHLKESDRGEKALVPNRGCWRSHGLLQDKIVYPRGVQRRK